MTLENTSEYILAFGTPEVDAFSNLKKPRHLEGYSGSVLLIDPVATLSDVARQLEAHGLGPTHGNLDSIEDSLASLDMYELAGLHHSLILLNADDLAAADPKAFGNLLEVMADAQASFREDSPETILDVVVCLPRRSEEQIEQLVKTTFPKSPPCCLQVVSISDLAS